MATAALLVGLAMATPAMASTDLFKCFQSGSGATFTKVCVSSHGNISAFEAPQHHEHIRSGYFGEGYALCDNSGAVVHGYDAGPDEAGFGPSVIGPGPTITRSTTDGAFKLKQTYAFVGPEGEMKINMTVTNTSGSTRPNVVLSRYFDGDVDSATHEFGSTTSASVFEWQTAPGHGLKLTALSFSVPHTPSVETFFNWRSTTQTGCLPMAEVTPTGPADLTGRNNYNLGNLAPGASKTVVYSYQRI